MLAYKNLEKPGQKWHIHGWFCLIGCFLLMMYYTTVTGWMVSYFGKFLTGAFHAGHGRRVRCQCIRRNAGSTPVR